MMELFHYLLAAIILITFTTFTESKQYKVCPGKPADIAFIIDESSSIWPVHYRRQREFIANLTDQFEVGPEQTRIAAVTFADHVTLRLTFENHQSNEAVRKVVQNIDQKTGGTRTDRALKFVRHKIFGETRAGVPKIAVLITDGASWYPRITAHEAEKLKQHNVTIFTVAISNRINWDEINAIASNPDEQHVFSVDSFDDLGLTLVEKLVTSTCKVQGNPVGECDLSFQTDVMFVLASASQNPIGAIQGLGMIHSVISDQNTFVGHQSLRIGLLPKQCQLDFGFNLNSYDNKEFMLAHIQSQKRNLLTPADHLNYLATEAYTKANGDREDVRNLAVVIIDTSSTNPEETITAAQRAKDAGVELMIVAVGKDVNDEEISKMASEPTAVHKITLADYSELVDLKHKFYSFICP